jgi:ABC-type transporter Mla subunit MlaD
MKQAIVRCLSAVFAAMLLASCSDNKIEVIAHFANTHHFETGTPVYFNDEVVGQVSSIDEVETGANVTLSLNPEAADVLGSSAAAVVNRLKDGAPLELYNRSSRTTEPLQDGQTIKGLDSMLQLGAWMLGDAIQVGQGTLSEYVQSFQDYLSGDDFERDKAAVKQQFDNARDQANAAMERLGSELQATGEALAESERQAAEAIEEMGQQLAPMVEDMAGDGARLAEELQRFAESLEQQSREERQAGEAFLASLLTTLERLNLALEEGLKSNENDPAEVQPEDAEGF